MDAICYSKAVLSEGFPWTYLLPGVAATIALICMNLISREELRDMTDEQGEDEALVRDSDSGSLFSCLLSERKI